VGGVLWCGLEGERGHWLDQECKRLSVKPADKTEQQPTRTRLSEKWRKCRNSQNNEQQTKMHKTRIPQRSRQVLKKKKGKRKKKTKPVMQKTGEEAHNKVAFQKWQ
jgi:hypothetical protein